MSYCGACGSFYYEGCPRRPENICTPAPNPHDEAHADLMRRIAGHNGEVAGMIATNNNNVAYKRTAPHTDVAFDAVARKWGIIEP